MKIYNKDSIVNNTVVQSSTIVNAKYNLSLSAQKIVTYAISQIKEDDEPNKIYSMQLSSVLTNLGENYVYARNILNTLNDESIHIDLGKNHFYKTHWFAGIEYKDGIIFYTIDQKLLPYLLDLKRYIKYNIRHISHMRSAYAIRIYQLLLEYRKIGKRTFIVEDLQDILDVPKSLRDYGQFKRKVLLVAEKEINNSDYFVRFIESKKEKRKVLEITYTIKLKNSIISEEDRFENLLSECDVSYGERNDVRKVLNRFVDLSDEVILSNIQYVNSANYDNYSAYLTIALINDYASINRMIDQQYNSDRQLAEDCFRKHDEVCTNNKERYCNVCPKNDKR